MKLPASLELLAVACPDNILLLYKWWLLEATILHGMRRNGGSRQLATTHTAREINEGAGWQESATPEAGGRAAKGGLEGVGERHAP